MEISERMNAAIAYIEENLAGEIDFDEASKRACCSTFHFQRIFFAINGLTPAEYTRRRRLTLAATELISGNNKGHRHRYEVRLRFAGRAHTGIPERARGDTAGSAPAGSDTDGISTYLLLYRTERR